MVRLIVHKSGPLRGRIRVPGDKSISHRTLLIGAIAEGTSRVRNFLPARDCLATLQCVRALGVEVEQPDPTTLVIHGRGRWGLKEPAGPLHCTRSGTTMRLLAGILAGQPFSSTLTGDPQLLRRPMRRVVEPLRRMGARITDHDGHAPLHIRGSKLRGIDYTLPVASAQVKSAILLAGLFAEGPTTIHEPAPTRDHTERLLRVASCKLQVASCKLQEARSEGRRAKGGERDARDELEARHPQSLQRNSLTLFPSQPRAFDVEVPGDFSSAAFFIVAALLVPGSEITIEGVGVNPTRTGFLDVLQAMGAEITLSPHASRPTPHAPRPTPHAPRPSDWEPVADITVRTAELRGTEVCGSLVPRMIDEFPILAVAATQARGTTTVRDARELRVKETDRIANLVAELRKLGAEIEELPDGFIVHGPTPLRGAVVRSYGDHRLAMALAVAGLVAEGETTIEDADCIADSFPGFEEILHALMLNPDTFHPKHKVWGEEKA